jgi:hypothetical protein
MGTQSNDKELYNTDRWPLDEQKSYYLSQSLTDDLFGSLKRGLLVQKGMGKMKKGPRFFSQASVAHGTPEGIRTPDLRIRSPLLYPAELQAHKKN